MQLSWGRVPKPQYPMAEITIHVQEVRCYFPDHREIRDDLPSTYSDSVTDNLFLSDPRIPRPKSRAPELVMTTSTYDEIMTALTSRPPEAGGLLLGPKNHRMVTHFHFDERALTTASTFTLDHTGINNVLKEYGACKLDAKGLVHSHPDGCTAPSSPDLEYVQRLFANPKNGMADEIWMPIVCGGRFYPYVIHRKDASSLAKPQLAELVRL